MAEDKGKGNKGGKQSKVSGPEVALHAGQSQDRAVLSLRSSCSQHEHVSNSGRAPGSSRRPGPCGVLSHCAQSSSQAAPWEGAGVCAPAVGGCRSVPARCVCRKCLCDEAVPGWFSSAKQDTDTGWVSLSVNSASRIRDTPSPSHPAQRHFTSFRADS